MDKLQFTKMLGLKVEFEYCDDMYEEGDNFGLEMEFTIGGKYFMVQAKTKELAWDKAANLVVDNMLKHATMNFHSESSRYR